MEPLRDEITEILLQHGINPIKTLIDGLIQIVEEDRLVQDRKGGDGEHRGGEGMSDSDCPYCGSPCGMVELLEIETEDGETAYETSQCAKCGRRWMRVFTFSHLIDEEGKRILPEERRV